MTKVENIFNQLKQIPMNNNNQSSELSYYELSLLSFLKESHPQLALDTNFIKIRADEAAETYSNAIKSGSSQEQAQELANEVLYLGLHFSKHDTLVNILWNEFADIIPQSEAKGYAVRLQAECEEVFAKYNLTDEYLGSEEYDVLYTELTGCIDLWLEDNEYLEQREQNTKLVSDYAESREIPIEDEL